VALGAVVLLSGCASAEQWARGGLPEPASDQAVYIQDFWVGSWIAALAVGLITWGLIFWAVIAYRSKDDDLPPQTKYNLPIEAFYTAVPFVIIFVFFFWTYQTGNNVLARSEQPSVTIGVVGQQWSWTFNYLAEDPAQTVHEVGLPVADQLPELWLPVNEPVLIRLNSPDVIHSFWVPHFLFKMDVVPGRTNEFEVTPTKEGVFAGKCAELCGAYHSRMLFEVHVVPRAEYDAHLAELAARGQVGEIEAPLRGAFAPTPLGERPRTEIKE
jgi:cytochrome c oxidase subunit 2